MEGLQLKTNQGLHRKKLLMIFLKMYENIFQHTSFSSRKKFSGSGTIQQFTKQGPGMEGCD